MRENPKGSGRRVVRENSEGWGALPEEKRGQPAFVYWHHGLCEHGGKRGAL